MPSYNHSVLNDSKKGYTLREKSDILHYIIKKKAHHEVKGRAFWMTMEKSKITPRTWQSLKEVFLKRILPDLHNPYYKLSQEQIREFSQRNSKATNSKGLTWMEKNKATDNLLNRSMTVEKESPSKSTIKPNDVSNNKQNSKTKQNNNNNVTDDSTDSDIQSIDDSSLNKSTESNMRITRNRDKENNLNQGDSQSSQPVESFPTSQLLTSTPKKSLIQSKMNSPDKYSPKPKLVTPAKQTLNISKENSSKRKILNSSSKDDSEGKQSVSSNILLLSSNDSSLSEDESHPNKKQRQQNIKNNNNAKQGTNVKNNDLFGFSTGKTVATPQKVVNVCRVSDSSDPVIINDIRPTTSNFVSPSRPNKFVKRQKSFIYRTSSDSDGENGNSSDSQYSYYRNSDTESLKRKGKKLYGLFRGKLVPLYEPKRKCCVERKEFIANGRISKKRKITKAKGPVYIDNSLEPISKNGHSNDKGDKNVLAKEALNFWKIKYLCLKRRNDEMLRLLTKQKNEDYINSVTKMLSEPVPIRDAENNADNLLTKNNFRKDEPSIDLNKMKTYLDTDKPTGSGKKILIASSKSSNQPSTSKNIAEGNNVVVIDSQKADIIIDILKKVSEMKQPIDRVKVNNLMNSPNKNSIMAPQLNKSPNKMDNVPSTSSAIHKVNTTPSKSKIGENLPPEIKLLREKERLVFEQIAKEKSSGSNTRPDIFSKSELEILFDEKEIGKSDKTKEKDTPQADKDKANTPIKNLRSSNRSVSESKTQSEQKKDAGVSKNTDLNKSDITPTISNTESTIKTRQNTRESHTEDLNKTNYLPESMDIGESVKFAINPNFFSILFPNESKNKKDNSGSKRSNKSQEIIPSSDDESVRYALPKPSNNREKKQRNRKSTGKIIKLKMFGNIKKRQSFSDDEEFLHHDNRTTNIWNQNENLGDSEIYSDYDTNESLEIPIQRFSVNSVNLDSQDCVSLNTIPNEINMCKPLLEQSLGNFLNEFENSKEIQENPNACCQFGNFSQGNICMSFTPENYQTFFKVSSTNCIVETHKLHQDFESNVEIEPVAEKPNSNVLNENSDSGKLRNDIEITKSNINKIENEYDESQAIYLNRSDTLLFDSFVQSNLSSLELNITNGSSNDQDVEFMTISQERRFTRLRMIDKCMSEEDSDDIKED